jgi:hypothetical protein
MSGQHEVAALWECTACGSAFAGVLLLESLATRAQSVRLAQLHFGEDHIPPLPKDFAQAVADLSVEQTGPLQHAMRRSARDFRRLNAIVVGLDNNFILADQSCRSVVVNLSSHGMMLATPGELKTTHVAVQMQGAAERVQVLGRVVWSRHLTLDCFGAGIDFTARLGKVPADVADSHGTPIAAAGPGR